MSEKCPIIAIDPGNRQSAYCVIDCNTLKPLEFGKVDNEELRNKLVFANEQGWQWAVIEMVASYGMAVGREVFDTVLWIGRFYEALSIQMAQKPRLLCRIEEKRHICHDSRANDPACGAGALLIAFANLCRRKNICYHDKVLFVAQDIDLIAGLMCYIQLSFLGCAGYVVIGNTITEPSTAYDRRGLLPAGPQSRIWYTPFFSTDIWFLRRQWAQIELLMKPVCRQTEQAEPEHKKDDAAPPLCETKTGQLTFF